MAQPTRVASPAAAPGTVPGYAPAPPTAPVDRSDRREAQRRDARVERGLPGPVVPGNERPFFPAQWPFLIGAVVASILASLVFAKALPDLLSMVMLALALLGMVPVQAASRFKAGRPLGVRLTVLALVALLPLMLFGLGMTRWAAAGGLSFELAVGSMLAVNCIATTYLRRQPVVIFVAQLALWSSLVIQNPSLEGEILLVATLGLAVLVGREQAREYKVEVARRAAVDRVNSRARDILADYEETRQGWFWETDRRGLLTYVSSPAAKAIGRSQQSLIGQPLVQLFDLGDTGQEGERTLMFHLSARSSFQELAVRAASDRDVRWWSVSGRPVYDSFANFVGFRGSGTDLTERKRSQEQATRLARYDSLTGLANRLEMSQALEKILASPREASRACAVLLLDLDRFKQVNDTMGHPAGDALLKQVAQRLERAVGKMGQVGRLGGDEFKAVLPGRIERRVLADLATEIIHSLSQPYSIDGQRVIIGASVGIAVAPDDGTTSEELIRNADLALYAAKDGGRGRHHFYAQDLHAEAEARSQLEEDLRDAITQGNLQLFYQPVVSMATEQITGFEALLRWQHPEKGWINPQKFVQTAEDSGLIMQIGEWALRTACRNLATWPEEVLVAVNVSPLQFANPQLPAIVTSAIAQAGVDPSRLELEITESVFLDDNAGTDAMFAALKAIGVRLALDDFGTGYSSLGYLKKAPFDKIKIDQSFVRGATQPDSRNGAIIASITSLAHALGMDTTAEGVETMDELDLVRMQGCTHVQGYIYERALSAEAASERLLTGLGAVARGPRSARAPRQKMLRKVVMDHHGQLYNGTIRNISDTGALLEGLWNVPVGTIFQVDLSDSHRVTCTTRWCLDDRMGVEFTHPLQRDHSGRIIAISGRTPTPVVKKIARPQQS
ncbi:MAG: EAL domain-containing protein [Croceibacterium sp.]